jgi:hypothetical protein
MRKHLRNLGDVSAKNSWHINVYCDLVRVVTYGYHDCICKQMSVSPE